MLIKISFVMILDCVMSHVLAGLLFTHSTRLSQYAVGRVWTDGAWISMRACLLGVRRDGTAAAAAGSS
eukprot:COSAG02_NODE_728_length_17995_cov_52.042244_16_plen_68_part_00